jgi:hypothetical protein
MRPEELFQSLSDAAAIHALIGKTEDLHLDCKLWPLNDQEAQKTTAKAVCGFANADGGVVVIGLRAKPGSDRDDPDQIQAAEQVPDTNRVKSTVQDLIGKLVEPGVSGVRVEEVRDPAGSKSGFVIVLVPSTEGLPCRSRKDWKFYQRISSGTYPMEYFQIADMFGKRRRPLLDLHIEEKLIHNKDQFYRTFEIGITNAGRAVAKYPGLRFLTPKNGIVVIPGYRGQLNLPIRFTDSVDWIIFGGGVDDVIYPGATIKVATLTQPSHEVRFPEPKRVLPAWTISVQLSAEDIETKTVERMFEEMFTY